MVDTVTPNYGLTKPEDGASDDTWGVKLNANFDIIDAALKTQADSIDVLIAIAADPAALLAALTTVDGPGSGLNADLLDGYEAADFMLAGAITGPSILASLLAVDGAGSGLDADLLDGFEASAFALTGDLAPYATTAAVAAGYQPLDADLTAIAAVASTAYGRSLLALADQTALQTAVSTLGTLTAGKFILGTLMFQWGAGTLAANTAGTINFPTAFSGNVGVAITGGPVGTASEGDVHSTAAAGNGSVAIVNSGNAIGHYHWIAVGAV